MLAESFCIRSIVLYFIIMLLFVMGYFNFGLRNPTIFRSYICSLFRNITDAMLHTYAVKLSLIYLVASVGASSYENEPSFLAVCDDASMHLNVDFIHPFHGLIYTGGNAFIPECSFPTSPLLNNTKLVLTLPFSICSFNVNAIDEGRISISTSIVVQQHRMMTTSYDILQKVSCELPLTMDTFLQSYSNITLTDGHSYTSLPSPPDVRTWIETKVGSDFLPDDGSEVGAELFLVVNVRDGGKNRDVSVHNCIAHDDKVLTNETRLYQMSNVFGCPNSSDVLSNFTVSKGTEGHSNLMAYTQMRNLVFTVKEEFFITCGVVLCEKSCSSMCEDEAIPTMHYLNAIAVKRFVGRLPGATLPPSLNLFETRQRISKRSLVEFLTRLLFGKSSDLNLKDGDFQREDHVTETTQTPQLKQLGNTTDVLVLANISQDLEVHTSSLLSRSTIILANETLLSDVGHNYDIPKNSIWSEFTVCVLFLFLVGCYGGFFYANSKTNLRTTR